MFLNKPVLIFFTQFNGFNNFCLIQIIPYTINHLCAQSLIFSSIAINSNNSIKHKSFIYIHLMIKFKVKQFLVNNSV